jgi:hypothetical protein
VWVEVAIGRVRVGLGQFDLIRLLSGHESGRVRLGRVSDLLVSGHFRFRVVSGHVGSVIGSYSVGSFWISGRVRSGQVGYRVI